VVDTAAAQDDVRLQVQLLVQAQLAAIDLVHDGGGHRELLHAVPV